MDNPERRNARRYVVHVPLNFRPRPPREEPNCFAEMQDVSPTGVSFSTKAPPPTGSGIDLFLRMPPDVLGSETDEWLWVGTVVHSHPCPASDEWTIVGVKFCGMLCRSGEKPMESSVRAHGEPPDVRKSIPADSVEPGQPNEARRETPSQRVNSKTTAPVRKWSRFDMSGRRIP